MTEPKDIVELPRTIFATLAIEVWRLWHTAKKMKGHENAINLSYSVGKMRQLLERQGCSFIDLTGKIYDAGMAVDVIDTEGDCAGKVMDLFIKEMVAPIILFGDTILIHGQVILERRAKTESIAKE